ncbi:MAG TPA: ATP-binding protein, partial [Leptospiraceae bacterium]|nr:ATP-binding protein [Leptospiraceae bacterium]
KSMADFLTVEADCRMESSGMSIQRKKEMRESEVPLSIINNVHKTGRMIVLENASASGDFVNDPYVKSQSSKSILCFPVENRNKLLGIIYLENSLAAYVFSESRVEILNILSLQIAISLQNAKFITDIEEARKKAEEANAVKSDFLANMSHEIKTPMNGILGMKSLLEMTDLNLEQKEYLRVIGICSESLLIIINDILNISKLESGSISLEELPFDLSRSAADTVQIVQNEIRQKKLYLDFHIDNDVPQFIIGDESRLRQILLNLLNNAVKFTNTGGIDFSIRLRGRAENRAYIEFSVKDTGIGIEEEKLSKIFDPFTQADSSISRKFGGTGLGLAISRKLAELLGGSITAESAFGKGSNFILSLNAEEYQISDKSRTENPEVDFREPKQNDFPSILLIEENIIDKNLIIKLLKNIGYRIKNSVLNSAEAEKKLRFGNYDLILMDMEKNDAGADALRSFQEIFHEKNSPVIIGFVNGINEEVKNMYVKAGVSDFISKPIDINEMKHKILYWTSSIKKQ